MITSCYWCIPIQQRYLNVVCLVNQNHLLPADKTHGAIPIHPSIRNRWSSWDGHTVTVQTHARDKTNPLCIYDFLNILIFIKALRRAQKWLKSLLPVCLMTSVFVYTSAVGRMLWETWLCERWIKQTRQNEGTEIKGCVQQGWGSSKSG